MKAASHVVGMILTLLCFVSPAHALNGPTLLGFLDYYLAPDGSESQHRGIDIDLPAGSQIEAPVSGSVRFAGRVPGPHGGSIVAVSLETESGIVSMLPFDETTVVAGEHVEKGVPLGRLAAQGDPSSDSPHLHLGLKRGSVYVDPSALLEAAPASAPQEPAPEPVPVGDASPAPAPASALPAISWTPSVPSVVPSPVTVGEPSPTAVTAQVAQPDSPASARTAPEGAAVTSPAEAVFPKADPQARAEGPRSVDTQSSGAELAPGVTVAPEHVSALPAAGAAGLARVAGTAPTARLQVAAGQSRQGEPSLARGALAYGAAALGAALFGSLLLLTRRTLARGIVGISPVSDRFGILLQHLKAGDTLCGLTSCSGHAAFTVPEPLAQRR